MKQFRLWQHHASTKLLRSALFITALVVVLTLGWGRQPAQATTAQHYTDLSFPPLPDITLPDYTRFVMDNGITVYLVEDHELPLIDGTAIFRTGDRLEPAQQVGLASIVGEVMRSGGTRKHPADTLNQLLEQRAAYVETGIDTTSGSASFGCLTEDLTDVFGLFAEVLREPAFPQDKIELSKTGWRGSIARRNDSPDSIVGREFQKLIYGADSPYARTVEYQTLDKINRPDLVRFYQQYFHPNTMLLGIVGDFDRTAMRSLIEEKFGNWQPRAIANARSLPAVDQAKQGGVYLIDQPQLTQSYVQLGHLGGQLNNPDHAALSIFNELMNGFGGRLVNQVRSRQGLAYVVYAYWSPQFDYPGVFVSGGQTRTDATVPFIKSVMSEIEQARSTPITPEELQRAKDSVLNAFIFNFQTPSQTLSRLMRYDYYDYPSDFIFQYRRAVEVATGDDVLRAAQTYLQPEKMVTLVVGNAAAIRPPLNSLTPDGTVIPIDITIPGDNLQG